MLLHRHASSKKCSGVRCSHQPYVYHRWTDMRIERWKIGDRSLAWKGGVTEISSLISINNLQIELATLAGCHPRQPPRTLLHTCSNRYFPHASLHRSICSTWSFLQWGKCFSGRLHGWLVCFKTWRQHFAGQARVDQQKVPMFHPSLL